VAFDPHPLLDLDVTARAETFRFDLLDASLNRQGTLSVSKDTTPKIDHNSNRSIKRTMSGLKLSPRELLSINPISDRVQPVMVLSDGSEWPLGVFVFGDFPRARYSHGVIPEGSFVDLGISLDQPCPRNVGFIAGTHIGLAILACLNELGLSSARVDPVDTVAGSSITYKAGETWLSILNDLAGRAGLYSPAFDHSGRCLILSPPPADDTASADVTYDEGGRIFDGTILETDNTLDAPNRYVCIDTAATDAPIVGVFDVPAAAPHSIANRGYAVTTTIEVQGIGSVAAAQARARRAYLSARSVETVSFATSADPRHDVWNTVAYRGACYREQSWSISCKAGAPMTHEIRRFYS
jgi:hypothetical protein